MSPTHPINMSSIGLKLMKIEQIKLQVSAGSKTHDKTTKFQMDRPWVLEPAFLIFKIDTEIFQIIFKLTIFKN